MKNLSITLFAVMLAAVPATGFSAGGKAELEHFTPVRTDSSLQRGARLYANYCQGCHTADYQRYSRTARDIGLSDEAMSENLIFTTDVNGDPTKVGSLMTNNMTKSYAETAFGVAPPNLALVSKSRGVDWLYTYMKSFYLDESRKRCLTAFKR